MENNNDDFAVRKGKELLYDLDTERIVLGTLIVFNEQIGGVLISLHHECFYSPFHASLYDKILCLYNKGEAPCPRALRNFVVNHPVFKRDEGDPEVDEGSKYLSLLVDTASPLYNIKQLAQLLVNYYKYRQITKTCSEAIQRVGESTTPENASQILDETESKLFKLHTEHQEQGDNSMHNLVAGAVRSTEELRDKKGIRGITTGYKDLDNMLDGFQSSDLIILAARPSMGKTALALNMAIRQAANLAALNANKKVFFFSLEMSAAQLTLRVLSILTGTDAYKIRKGSLDDNELDKIKNISGNNANLLEHMAINDGRSTNVNMLRAKLRSLQRSEGISCVFIDYLQLMHSSEMKNYSSKVYEIAEITQGLKSIAKEFNIPVVVMSQLSRAVESRDDKMPQLSDLRDSGSIEQDADVVMFLYREAYYLKRKQPRIHTLEYTKWEKQLEDVKYKADIVIAKHRNGPTGIRVLSFNEDTTEFYSN